MISSKQIDPCALASLTTGVLLCEEGFGRVAKAAEHLLGHPVWTHEFIDPKIKAALAKAVLDQFPDMPIKVTGHWRDTVADLRRRYGDTVDVVRGQCERDRGPVETLTDIVGDRASIIAVEIGGAA